MAAASSQAALEACRLRLRPILMTSIAFIMGVLPLVFSHGAGAEMRHAMGVAVFAGMLGVTFFGLFLTPVFYVLLRTLAKRFETADACARACMRTRATRARTTMHPHWKDNHDAHASMIASGVAPLLAALLLTRLRRAGLQAAGGGRRRPPSRKRAPPVTACSAPPTAARWKAAAAGRSPAARRMVAAPSTTRRSTRLIDRGHAPTTRTWRWPRRASSRRAPSPASPKPTASRRSASASAPSARACRRWKLGLPPGTPVAPANAYQRQPDGQLRGRPVRPRVAPTWRRRSGDAGAVEATYRSVLLSLQADVAQTYFRLRALDAELATVEPDRAPARGKRARHPAPLRRWATSANSTWSRAKTELATARAEAIGLQRQRATAEHALAVLLGKPAAGFARRREPAAATRRRLPVIPAGLPSTLLERRPDIAAAQRAMEAANARIGVARSAMFPALDLAPAAAASAAASPTCSSGAAVPGCWAPRCRCR